MIKLIKKVGMLSLMFSLLAPNILCASNKQAEMHKTNVAVLSSVAAICYLNAIREGLATIAMAKASSYSFHHQTLFGVSSGILCAASLGLGITATVGAVKQFKKYKQESKK